jgi:hypothetical protein
VKHGRHDDGDCAEGRGALGVDCAVLPIGNAQQ